MAETTNSPVELGTQYDATIKVKQVTNIAPLQDGELYYQIDGQNPHLYVKFGSNGIQLAEQSAVDAKADETDMNTRLNEKVNTSDLKTLGGYSLTASGGGNIDWPIASQAGPGGIKPGNNCVILPDGTLNVQLTPLSLDDMCNDGTYTYNFTYRQLFEEKYQDQNGFNVVNTKIDIEYLSNQNKTDSKYFSKPFGFECNSTKQRITLNSWKSFKLLQKDPTTYKETNKNIFWWACKTNFTGKPPEIIEDSTYRPNFELCRSGSSSNLERISSVTNLNIWETQNRLVPLSWYDGVVFNSSSYLGYHQSLTTFPTAYVDLFVFNQIPESLAATYCNQYKLVTDQSSSPTPVAFWHDTKDSDNKDIKVELIKNPNKEKAITMTSLRTKVRKAMAQLYENYCIIKKNSNMNGIIPIYGEQNIQNLDDGLYYCHPNYNSTLNVGNQYQLKNGLLQITKIGNNFNWSFQGNYVIGSGTETYDPLLYGVTTSAGTLTSVKSLYSLFQEATQ